MAISVHVVLLKLPPETLAVHVTVPVGTVFVPILLISLTLALNVIILPALPVAGLGDTLTLVLRKSMVIVAVAELDECAVSPEYVAVIVIVILFVMVEDGV